MKKYILVACEESQAVCKAFRKFGFIAFSADLQECSGGHPEWHIVGDVLPIMNGGRFKTMDGKTHHVKQWDLVIAHPPCTYLSNAGSPSLFRGHVLNVERYHKGMEGRKFFMEFFDHCTAKHVCIENPTPCKIYNLPEPSQAIQPYQFGHPYSKRTLLWLKGLPNLTPTEIVKEHECYTLAKGIRSPKMRSKTFSGIASAMVEQWSAVI